MKVRKFFDLLWPVTSNFERDSDYYYFIMKVFKIRNSKSKIQIEYLDRQIQNRKLKIQNSTSKTHNQKFQIYIQKF